MISFQLEKTTYALCEKAITLVYLLEYVNYFTRP